MVSISAKEGDGLELLLEQLREMVFKEKDDEPVKEELNVY